MKALLKVEHTALFYALFSAQVWAAEAAPAKSWVLAADYQYRGTDAVSHSGGVTGEFGRARSGLELIYQQADRAVDLEWYRYANRFSGNIAGTDRSYGDTTDVMITGFRQWDWNQKYGVQLIYALEFAAEEGVSLGSSHRWGLGAAARWRPDAETDVALGVLLEDRFEDSILPIPYVKATWRPCKHAEVELRATGLQNGLIVRGFLTEDRATTVDFTVAYETLSFGLKDGSYGSRAVAIGEVPLRVGVTQFLEKSGTWFVRGSAEWVAYARHSFKHDGETQGSFQPGANWGVAARVGARF
ncbi:MAG: hypothetical protein RJA95_77 [Verrucomicrobiota bacterium]|jgi:hypothetical protein